MRLPLSLADRLQALCAHGPEPHDLARGVNELLNLARRAVPSCLGLSLTLERGGPPLTMTALVPVAGEEPVGSSLALRLPSRQVQDVSSNGGAVLILYAAARGAFDHVTADLLALLDLDPGRATVDGHLTLPGLVAAVEDFTERLDDLGAVDRALGVLLDRGFLQADGRCEIDRLAAVGAVSIPTAARSLLATARPATFDR